MKTSESITKIASALLKAQKDMEGAKKDSNNPFFKSKYADYNSVLEACKAPLNDNGISILQPHRIDNVDGNIYMVVETILLHESGEFISGETKVEVSKVNDPQALGSAQSYARRYGLQSLVSLPSEDDDGESAMNRTEKKSSFAKPAKQKEEPKKVEESSAVAPEATEASSEAPKRSFRKSKA